MKKSTIYIIIGISLFLIITIYVFNFHKTQISTNPEDWNSFASYINGMITPILAFINILILMEVKNAVSDIDVFQKKHKKKLRAHNRHLRDFQLKINENNSIEDNLRILDDNINQISELFEDFHHADEQCEQDLYELTKKAKLSAKSIKLLKDVPYYENPFVNRMWEMHNIGVSNTMTETIKNILQLKVNTYQLMVTNNPADQSLLKKYKSAQKDLEDYIENAGLVD